jgi:hypothetical protein
LPASRRMDAQAQVYSSLHYRRVEVMGALVHKTEQYSTIPCICNSHCLFADTLYQTTPSQHIAESCKPYPAPQIKTSRPTALG